MSDDDTPRPGASPTNRAVLVGAALTLLALLLQVASPVGAWVVLYGP